MGNFKIYEKIAKSKLKRKQNPEYNQFISENIIFLDEYVRNKYQNMINEQTVINDQFWADLSLWINDCPANKKEERYKRMFFYEFIEVKLTNL